MLLLLLENLKETEEKWQTALREIDAFQQTQLESTNSQIDELQNLFHKISIYEKQIGDQCHLLEVNDRTIKSLQSDLCDKEKRLEILETQKIEMTANTLVTDSNIVSDDVSNVVEMERTISSLKEQIAGMIITIIINIHITINIIITIIITIISIRGKQHSKRRFFSNGND